MHMGDMYFSMCMELRHFSWQFSRLRLYDFLKIGFFQDFWRLRFLAFKIFGIFKDF